MTEENKTGANKMHTFLSCKEQAGPLPRLLDVQTDNCTRENKNKGVMDMVFYGVLISSLPIGHTHEDESQVVSLPLEHPKCHAAFTMEKLVAELPFIHSATPSFKHEDHSQLQRVMRLISLSLKSVKRNAK